VQWMPETLTENARPSVFGNAAQAERSTASPWAINERWYHCRKKAPCAPVRCSAPVGFAAKSPQSSGPRLVLSGAASGTLPKDGLPAAVAASLSIFCMPASCAMMRPTPG